MTKGELRKARIEARTNGVPLTGELAIGNQPVTKPKPVRTYKPRYASREEQHGRYIDCGPSNWDDR